MKKTTILDYLPKSSIQKKNQLDASEEKIKDEKNVLDFQEQQNKLVKSLIQKSLAQVIEEQEDYNNICKILDNSWKKEQNRFGYSDKENIMVISTIQDFKKNFFQAYDINDFLRIKKINFQIGAIPKKKTQYATIKDIEYDSYYLSMALKILGDKCKIYQHLKMKLLFIKNEKYAALICPKF